MELNTKQSNQLNIQSREDAVDKENLVGVSISREEVQKMIDEAKTEIDKQIQTAQTSLMVTLMTTFGLFASILSFLTIEFQFLKTLTNIYEIISFTLILWSLLISFNLALDYISNNMLNKNSQKLHKNYIIIFTLGSLILGLIFLLFSKISIF